jgi:hypothetical protein
MKYGRPGPRPAGASEEACGHFVYWWDGEYEGNCERPVGHPGDHYDGMSWWNDDGDSTDHVNHDREEDR